MNDRLGGASAGGRAGGGNGAATSDDSGSGAGAAASAGGSAPSAGGSAPSTGSASSGSGSGGSGGGPDEPSLINPPAPVECLAPPCGARFDGTIGPFCGSRPPRFSLVLSAESDFIFYEPFLPLFLVIPAIERPDDPSGEAEELRLSIDATLDPPSAGQVDGNRVVLSSFPVVVTGTLPTRDFSTLPDFFEWVSVAEGEFYFSYVFLEDAYGNLLWSEVMRVRSNEDCER